MVNVNESYMKNIHLKWEHSLQQTYDCGTISNYELLDLSYHGHQRVKALAFHGNIFISLGIKEGHRECRKDYFKRENHHANIIVHNPGQNMWISSMKNDLKQHDLRLIQPKY